MSSAPTLGPGELRFSFVWGAFLIAALGEEGVLCSMEQLKAALNRMPARFRMVGLPEVMECPACEGSGRIVHEGTPGAYYRDGEKYDPPGVEDCDACEGTGRVDGS